MTLIESTVISLISLLTVLTPVEDITFVELTLPTNLPHVYIISKDDFEQTFCGCPCDLDGMFTGIQTINNVVGPTLLMKGNKEGEMIQSPIWNGVLYHELIHYRQWLQGKFTNEDYEKKITSKNLKLRTEIEREAYIGQNDFFALNGIPALNVEHMTHMSIMGASGQVKCSNGSIPSSGRNRLNPENIILKSKFNRELNKIYRDRVDFSDKM